MSTSARRAHGPLLLMALLAAYGSLYPFRFVAPASFVSALHAMLAQTQIWTTRGDVAGNLLLFVPIGVAIVYATNSGEGRWWRRALYGIAAAAFALLLQIAQLYVPARIAALSDALWNSAGTLAGIAIGQAVLASLPRWSLHGDQRTSLVLVALACWLAWRLWPFEPALSVPQVYRTLKPLIRLDALNAWSVASMAVSLLLIAGMVESLRYSRRWLLGAAVVGLSVRFILAGQAISTSVFAGTLLGVAAGLTVLRVGIERAGTWVIAIALIWYGAESLRPFVLSASPSAMSWMPFAAMLHGAMDINLASLSGVAFFSGALMLIGVRLDPAPGRWCVLLCAWILLLELVQRWVPTRTADVTVALLPVGWWLALRGACGQANHGA